VELKLERDGDDEMRELLLSRLEVEETPDSIMVEVISRSDREEVLEFIYQLEAIEWVSRD